ncbi:MAG: L-2-amino-thiazoline-4-carboxylic acid hydrolase [Chthonomonadales bacterium]
MSEAVPADRLNSIGVLRRREVEARILHPLIEDLSAEFGRERVLEILRRTIERIAREQGAELAKQAGGCTLAHFAAALEAWTRDGALEMRVLEANDTHLSFDVTRCRYAELYRDLGMQELGSVLSCNRDFALIEGFNPAAQLERAQTIMAGAPVCTFRYRIKPAETPEPGAREHTTPKK